ncbi:HlyD family efflux transporter periplasmic adaptor subunit [Olivibacter sp. SDN3]|uniref:HlyD family efflux transporter periplasmic adaptor subunit n=1 Tax=Olivibacter sp. SDN3 TaxID=2764720 RepID=UPI001651864C|nr:HlyD family efflux transporter periplasmic adaptor subunit [Olivibacter sp. SDN3]QNL49832.1 HlyD family efflux transporter periplasmic adaptor subunit [Olivibacter sp. SDN3]
MKKSKISEDIHTEDLQDIISKPPSWLLKWGISLVLFILLAIVTMSAFIQYPDIVSADIRINAVNAPKAVVPRVSGTLSKLLAKEGMKVQTGQVLAWMESSGKHKQVLSLLKKLVQLRSVLDPSFFLLDAPHNLDLGELQGPYQTFYGAYINYQSAIIGGLYLKQKNYLLREMDYEKQQQKRLREQEALYKKDYLLAQKEHQAYSVLAEKKVISPMEMQKRESALLSKQQPLQQISSNILTSQSNLTARSKELAELENKISTERTSFVQALNSIISEMEKWKQQYVLIAQQDGELAYSGIVQEKQYIEAGQPIFYINPKSTNYFGEMHVRQNNMGKVRNGQRVLINMNSYPYEEYGKVEGKIIMITDVPYRDSTYVSKVQLILKKNESQIKLKIGMTGEAEIITEDASLLKRFGRNITKALKRGN